MLQAELETALNAGKRRGNQGARLFMDSDNSRYNNDSPGLQAGERLLTQATQRIQTGLHGDAPALGIDRHPLKPVEPKALKQPAERLLYAASQTGGTA